MTFNPPINEQSFAVDVRSTTTVKSVQIDAVGAGSAAMTPAGGLRYDATLALPACAGAAEFTVTVRAAGFFSDRVNTFPDIGRFTHQINGQPEDCEAFEDGFAQTYLVDRTEDFPDSDPGDGQCFGVGAGDISGCSLRAAVMEANASPGAELIRLQSQRYTLTRIGGEGDVGVDASVRDLDITDDVTIEGQFGANRDLGDFLTRSNQPADDLKDDPGSNFDFAKIDAGGIDRAFQVAAPGVVLRLRQLAVVNGEGAERGGGILNAGELSLQRVALVENDVSAQIGPRGGGVYNSGQVVGEDVAFTQNGHVGANSAGAAFYNDGGTVELNRALIAYNGSRFGAAFSNRSGGRVKLKNTTLHWNYWRNPNDAPVSVASTADDGTETSYSFVTFSRHALGERNLVSTVSSGSATLANTLFVNNVADHCVGANQTAGGNVTDAPCTLSGTGAVADHIDVGIVSAAGALDDRGGFTPVYPINAVAPPSSLFSAVDKGAAPVAAFFDQRGAGFDRRVDGDEDGEAIADAGAFELED